MATVKKKYSRSLIAIALLIAAIWGINIWQHQSDVSKTRKLNKTKAADDKDPIPGIFTYGLDLKGGLSIVLEPKPGQTFNKGSLDTALEIIRNRVDSLGVAEPNISLQGDNILVQLPGIKDPARAREIIGATAKLAFRPVLGVVDPSAQPPAGVMVPDCANRETYPKEEPEKPLIYCALSTSQTGEVLPPSVWSKLVLGPVSLQGTDVSNATATLPGASSGSLSGWEVSLKLT